MKKKDRLFLGLPQSPEHPAPREGGTEKRGEDLHTCTHPWGWGVWPHPPKSIGGYVERGWEPGKASTTYTRQQGALEKWGVQLGNIPLGCGTHPGSVCNIKTPPPCHRAHPPIGTRHPWIVTRPGIPSGMSTMDSSSSSCSFGGFCCFLGLSLPPKCHRKESGGFWGGSCRRSHGPAARCGHRTGPTGGVWAKHLAQGISE